MTRPGWACTRTATSGTSSAPVVSMSLGDPCLFRVGGTVARRSDPARSAWTSGDVVVLGGEDRLSLPWRRPDLSGHVDAAEGWRADQPDAPGASIPEAALDLLRACAERHLLDQVILALLQDQVGARAASAGCSGAGSSD